jgi:2-polyprenyl-6-methoxyphenol hydroxylase-like FAD-dependent oxidoreductase
VLGADGAGSVARHAMGLRLEGWEDGEYAVYADDDVEMDFPFDSTTMVTDARGQRSVRPMGGKRVRLAFPPASWTCPSCPPSTMSRPSATRC